METKEFNERPAPAAQSMSDTGKSAMMGTPPAEKTRPVEPSAPVEGQQPAPSKPETTEPKTDLPDQTFTDAKNRQITIRAHNNGDHHMLRAYDRAQTPEVPAEASAAKSVSKCDLNEEKVFYQNQNTGELDKRTDRVRFNIDTPSEEYKKSGIGGRMIESAEEVSQRTGALEMYGTFSPEPGREADLRRFYEKHGFSFRKVGEGDSKEEEVYKTFFFQ